ncbi:hypothetical protein MPLSOD_40823 [Mesorhizobium sp. SOD10]|nr:hypothetical protein MPLSOD_40823 [Mesorhizobium sp. SOD10]
MWIECGMEAAMLRLSAAAEVLI